MAAPFIFITTYAIDEGTLDGFRQFLRELMEVLEARVPRALAINAYVRADGTEAAIVQVHPDAASMKEYWRVLHAETGQAIGAVVERTVAMQVYGPAGDVDVERTRHSARSGVAVSVMPEHLAGFTRLASTGEVA